MSPFVFLLVVITVMLFVISSQLSAIAKRMRQHFPTDKEADYDWAKNDPVGHWEAHKNDYKRPAFTAPSKRKSLKDQFTQPGTHADDTPTTQ